MARTTSSWREVLSKSSSEFTTVIVPVFLSIANDAEDPSDGREKDRSPGCVRAITEVTLWPFRADSGTETHATKAWPSKSSGQLRGAAAGAVVVQH